MIGMKHKKMKKRMILDMYCFVFLFFILLVTFIEIKTRLVRDNCTYEEDNISGHVVYSDVGGKLC